MYHTRSMSFRIMVDDNGGHGEASPQSKIEGGRPPPPIVIFIVEYYERFQVVYTSCSGLVGKYIGTLSIKKIFGNTSILRMCPINTNRLLLWSLADPAEHFLDEGQHFCWMGRRSRTKLNLPQVSTPPRIWAALFCKK